MSERTRNPRGGGESEVIDSAALNRLLRRMRSDCKAETIAEAALAVGELGEAAGENPKVVRALVKALAKPDDAVRERAIAALRKLKCHEVAVPLLVKMVSDPDEATARTASSALGVFGARALAHIDVAALLREWAELRDDRSRTLASAFFRSVPLRSRNARICLTLIELLWSGGEADRLEALEILGSHSAALIAHERSLEIIRQGMGSESAPVRNAAIEALTAGVPGPSDEVLQALCEHLDQGLKGDDGETRRHCAEVLHRLSGGALEVREVSLLVADALLNWDPDVRRIAASCVPSDLEQMCGEPEVLERLGAVLTYGTDDVQGLAEETLRRLNG